jgi:hypothetical protein
LETGFGVITEQNAISKHIMDFYMQLFESTAHRGVHLSSRFWGIGEKLGETEIDRLNAPFSKKELSLPLNQMDSQCIF